MKSLIQMGIVPMAQRIVSKQTLIAGRLKLFLRNWRVITQDLWVLECVYRAIQSN